MGQRNAFADAAIAAGAGPAWLLTLALPSGELLHISSSPLTVATRGRGGPYQFSPLLLGIDDFSEELDVFGLDGIGALTQARIELLTTVDLASQQGSWYHIMALTAELSLLWPGQSWEDRQTLLDGAVVQALEIGSAGEGTTFTLETASPASSAAVGDDTRTLDADYPDTNTFLSAATISSLSGRTHNWVFGSPKSVPAYKVGDNASGGVANWLVLCGHYLKNLSSVTVYNNSVSLGSASVVRGTDSFGEPFSYLAGGAAVYDESMGALTWSADTGGVARADDLSRQTSSAGQVLRALLKMSGLKVDYRRCTRAFRLLAEWPIGFYVDKAAGALDIIREYLLPYLPIAELTSADGLYYAYLDPHIPGQLVEGELILGQNLLGRIGKMTTSDLEQIKNSWTIQYYRDEAKDSFTKSLTVDSSNSALCYLSRQLLSRAASGDNGLRCAETIACPFAWDATTAMRIGLALASRLALPRRIVEYAASPDLYWLDVGGVYKLTDDTLGISKQRAVITAINRSQTPNIITVEFVDRTALSR